jgi:hypothetical protein
MKNLTIIIPVFNLNDVKVNLLSRAIESVDDSNILIVGVKSDIEKVVIPKDKTIKTLINDSDNTTYPYQVNLAVQNVNTDYFSVLEYDDTYTPIWFKNLGQYMENDTEDTFAFLPLTEVIDTELGPIGYANEAVWASSFSEEIGCYDVQSLEDYLDFNTSGGVFKVSDFKSLGMLKSSMKLTFWYEFLLRALYKGKRIFVIPKVGYLHYVGNEDTLTSIYMNNMDEKEANWWIDLAKKEYFFPHDRNKKYTEE